MSHETRFAASYSTSKAPPRRSLLFTTCCSLTLVLTREIFWNEISTQMKCSADVALLREEHAADREPDTIHARLMSQSLTYIDWLIDRDRKSTGLKSLQGKIWRQGYVDGTLKSQVFADVAPALKRWHAAGLRISIFSSGSVSGPTTSLRAHRRRRSHEVHR